MTAIDDLIADLNRNKISDNDQPYVGSVNTFVSALQLISTFNAPVTSVFGRIGAVVAAVGDYNFNQLSGSLAAAQFGALTGDITSAGGTYATTVSAIKGTTVSGVTGTVNAVLSNGPTLNGAAAPVTITGQVGNTALTTTNGNIVFGGTGSLTNHGGDINVDAANGFNATGRFGLASANPAILSVYTDQNHSALGTLKAGILSVGAVLTDSYLTGPANATLQHGQADAAAPVAQTVQFQSVVGGTANTAGANATLNLSRGTGTGVGGNLTIQSAPAGGAGSTQNALTPLATMNGNTLATQFFGQLIGKGTATNDDAAAGYIGEIIESEILAAAAVALTSGVTANVTSITLTAGDWDVWGNIFTNPNAATTTTQLLGSINTVSATLATTPNKGASYLDQNSYGAGVAIGGFVGQKRISVNANTTVYLVARATFAVNTNAAYGYIGARRRR